MAERTEIIAGLKSAIERGYDLDQAIQSFINSGYNRQDIEDSARTISEAVISKIPSEQTPQYKQVPAMSASMQATVQMPVQQLYPEQQQQFKIPQKEKSKSRLGWIILLAGILILLLIALFFFVFAKEQILDFLKNLGY